jgi:hypothetical protein
LCCVAIASLDGSDLLVLLAWVLVYGRGCLTWIGCALI